VLKIIYCIYSFLLFITLFVITVIFLIMIKGWVVFKSELYEYGLEVKRIEICI